MNLHNPQLEKLFQAARMVFREKPGFERVASSSSSPKSKSDKSEDKANPPADKLEKSTDQNGKTPEKKDEKKKEAPKKIGNVEIRNAARVRARQLKDNPTIQAALKKMEDAEKIGDTASRKEANKAAGQLMAILATNNPEDKNLAYWQQEASNIDGTKEGVEMEKLKLQLKKVYDDLNAKLPEEQKKHLDAQDSYRTTHTAFNNALTEFTKAENELVEIKKADNPVQTELDAATTKFNNAKTNLDKARTKLNEAETAKTTAEESYKTYKESLLKAAKDANIDHPTDDPRKLFGDGVKTVNTSFVPETPEAIEASKKAAATKFQTDYQSHPWAQSITNQATALEGQLKTDDNNQDIKNSFLKDVTRAYQDGGEAIKAYDRLMAAYAEYQVRYPDTIDNTADNLFKDAAWRFDHGAFGDAAKKLNESAEIYESINKGANPFLSYAKIDGKLSTGTQARAQSLKAQAESLRTKATSNKLNIGDLLSSHFINAEEAMGNQSWARAINQYQQVESMVDAAQSAFNTYDRIPKIAINAPANSAMKNLITQGNKYYDAGSFKEAENYYTNAITAYNNQMRDRKSPPPPTMPPLTYNPYAPLNSNFNPEQEGYTPVGPMLPVTPNTLSTSDDDSLASYGDGPNQTKDPRNSR